MATSSETRSLYNGVSNRSRGWKSRNTDDCSESRHAGIKRWDGTAKTCLPWDGLKRDSELWFSNGNCFVHLYGRGQSRRGPAFKVPLSALLAAKCQPLIDQFLADSAYASADSSTPDAPTMSATPPASPRIGLDSWSLAHLQGRVDLFIPPPPNTTKDQALLHQLVIRNLFAWIFRRPLVGEHLGHALSSLFRAMGQLRSPGADNVHALLSYVADVGYLYLAGEPDYALAILHLAETMQVRDLYIDAFTHCVGMYNRLYLGTEYQHISPTSRKLVRRARFEMDGRLGLAGTMLSNFLEDDLSAANLGLPALARAHLDRFRTYVQGFYASRLGYYPPISLDARTTIFEPRVYRILSEDFQALYAYLEDTSFTTDSIAPARAQGGICVQQCVEAFNTRHGFPPLAHPLPLLPDLAHEAVPSHGDSGNDGNQTGRAGYASRRITWLGGKTVDRLVPGRSRPARPDKRLMANTALLKATNKSRSDLWNNDFIRAYCQFEEYSVMKPNKAERLEKISMVDGRKVRWIFVYAVHQMLRASYTAPPPEARDTEMAPYHTSVSTEALPPWKDEGSAKGPKSVETPALPSFLSATWGAAPVPAVTVDDADEDDFPPARRSLSMTAIPALVAAQTADEWGRIRDQAMSPVFDISPDIDYLGLNNQNSDTTATTTMPSENDTATHRMSMLPRSMSLTRAMSQKSAFRRSIGLFRSSTSNSARPTHWRPLSRGGAQQGHDGSDGSGPQENFEAQRPRTIYRPSGRFTLLEPMLEGRAKQRTSSHRGRSTPAYHEIVVHGYGNGTNPVNLTLPTSVDSATAASSQEANNGCDDGDATGEAGTGTSAGRSLSTASSTASSTNSNESAATAKTASTMATSVISAGDAPVSVTGPPKENTAKSVAQVATHPTAAHSGRAAQATAASLSRNNSSSSSVYSTATAAAPREPVDTDSPLLPQPPPVPRRNSARHRRRRVTGKGGENAGCESIPPVPALPTQQLQDQYSTLGFPERMHPRSLQPHYTMNSSPALPQHLDMVQEALQAVQETMEQHDMGGMGRSRPGTRGTLRTVDETASTMSNSYRHSSYHAHFNDDGDDVDNVQPEWEKFSMGLGGHTVLV